MARTLFKKQLKPGRRAEYLQCHEAVPSAVTRAYRAAGIRNLSVFIHDDEILVYLECQDFASAQEALASDAACLAWDSRMAELTAECADATPGDPVQFFSECFHMD